MKECQIDDMSVSEMEVKVSLQSMLDKSVERLCGVIAMDWREEYLYSLEFIVTLGFDSSSGHTNPNQHCEIEENECADAQQSLFVSSLLICKLSSELGMYCLSTYP